MSTRILVVDDEPTVRSVLDRLLKKENYAVTTAATAQDGLRRFTEATPDLMILDLNLPDMSGEEVCQRVRSSTPSSPIPILILTGQVSEGLTAKCLDGGADDYLSKPFDSGELVARVRALLRRPPLYVAPNAPIARGAIAIYPAEHRVTVQGRVIPSLAPKEFSLLYQLVLHSPQVVEKNELALKVWGVPLDQLHSRTLDVHIRRIRQKLGNPIDSHLKTVPAMGFQWVAE